MLGDFSGDEANDKNDDFVYGIDNIAKSMWKLLIEIILLFVVEQKLGDPTPRAQLTHL